MKTKIILLFAVTMFLVSVINSNADYRNDTKTTTIDISSNMICHVSISIIEKAFKKAKGIESVEIDRNEKIITITYNDSKTDLAKLEKVLTKAGFKANGKDADMMGYDSLPDCCKVR